VKQPVSVTHDKVPVLLKKQPDWSVDKLTRKNLFELLILHLFQLFALKDLVKMYKIKKIVGNNSNCAIINKLNN